MGAGGATAATATTTTSSSASVTTIHNKRKATGSNASHVTTPTDTTDAGTSKKRPRSETNSDAKTAAEGGGANDDNLNNGNTASGGSMGPKKKKKTNNSIGNSAEPSSSNSLTFEEEIAHASSQATALLMESSLHRLADGIPRRELKLVISEARACETALENELRILKEGLELERRKKQNESKNGTSKGAGKKDSGKSDSEKKTSDHPPASNDEKKKGAKDESSSTTTTTAAASTTLTPKETAALETMIESEFSPPDTHWTLSALLGRLRHELTTPLPPRSQLPAHREKQGLTQLAQNVGMTSQTTYKKRGPKPQIQATPTAATANKASGGVATVAASTTNPENSGGRNNETTPLKATGTSSAAPKKSSDEGSDGSAIAAPIASPSSYSMLAETSQFKRLASLPDYPEYSRDHATPDKLLAVWKKLSTHRSSLVFRRPVNPKEAPGYTDRIRFPMDLSLIRKLVLSKHIKTYEGVLKQVHLIGHNCVKYNGRESDYALVTREFESVATEYIWNSVMREIYGSSRGRWSRNASPMPPSSSAVASPPASAPPAAVKSATTTSSVASTGSAIGVRSPATVTQTTNGSASGSSAKS